MRLSGGINFRKHTYHFALPAVGIPYLSEIEEHFHRPCSRHTHRETQLLILVEGAIGIWADDHSVAVRAGQACAIPPGLSHHVGAGDADPRAVYIDVRLGPATGPLHGFLCNERLSLLTASPDAVATVRRNLAAAVRASGPGQSAGVMATLWRFAAEVSGASPREESPSIDPRLVAVEQFMKERLSADISVDDLATISGLSRSQLCRLYAKTFNQSPAARLRQLRVKQAEHLLAHSTLSVKEVARVCGFACQNHFSRVYHELTGHTPTERRKH